VDDLLKRILFRVETEGMENLERLIEAMHRGDAAAQGLQSRLSNLGGGTPGSVEPISPVYGSGTGISAGDLQSVLSQFTGEMRSLVDALRGISGAARSVGTAPVGTGFTGPLSAGGTVNPSGAEALPFAQEVANATPSSGGSYTPGGVPAGISSMPPMAYSSLGTGAYPNLEGILQNLAPQTGSSVQAQWTHTELSNLLERGGDPRFSGLLSALEARAGVLSVGQSRVEGIDPLSMGSVEAHTLSRFLPRSRALGAEARGAFANISVYDREALEGLNPIGGAPTPFSHLETYLGSQQSQLQGSISGIAETRASAEAQRRDEARMEAEVRRESIKADYEASGAAGALAERLNNVSAALERYQTFLGGLQERVGGIAGRSSAEIAEESRSMTSEQRRLLNELRAEQGGASDLYSYMRASYGSNVSPEMAQQMRSMGLEVADTMRSGAGTIGEANSQVAVLIASQRKQEAEAAQHMANVRSAVSAGSSLGLAGAGMAAQYWLAGVPVSDIMEGTGGLQSARAQGAISGAAQGVGLAGGALGLAALLGAAPTGGLSLAALLATGAAGAGMGYLTGERRWETEQVAPYMAYSGNMGTLQTLLGGSYGGYQPGAEQAFLRNLPAQHLGYGVNETMSMMGRVGRTWGFFPSGASGLQGGESMVGLLQAGGRATGLNPEELMPSVELGYRAGAGTDVGQIINYLREYGADLGGGYGRGRFGQTLAEAMSMSDLMSHYQVRPEFAPLTGLVSGMAAGMPEGDRYLLGGGRGFQNAVAPILNTISNQAPGSFVRSALYQGASARLGRLSIPEFAALQNFMDLPGMENGEGLRTMTELTLGMGRTIGERMGGGELGTAWGISQVTGMPMGWARMVGNMSPDQASAAMRDAQGGIGRAPSGGALFSEGGGNVPFGAAQQSLNEVFKLLAGLAEAEKPKWEETWTDFRRNIVLAGEEFYRRTSGHTAPYPVVLMGPYKTPATGTVNATPHQ
jgi:hypothetical protein